MLNEHKNTCSVDASSFHCLDRKLVYNRDCLFTMFYLFYILKFLGNKDFIRVSKSAENGSTKIC
jgi:hypothetical protein